MNLWLNVNVQLSQIEPSMFNERCSSLSLDMLQSNQYNSLMKDVLDL